MKTTGDTTSDDRRAQHRERVSRWQRAQRAKGRCRCGAPIADTSASRCLLCLELERRSTRRRRGILTFGRKRRGRKMIGSLGDRRRAIERDALHRAWRAEWQRRGNRKV
jgi:hypothetical protein